MKSKKEKERKSDPIALTFLENTNVQKIQNENKERKNERGVHFYIKRKQQMQTNCEKKIEKEEKTKWSQRKKEITLHHIKKVRNTDKLKKIERKNKEK